MVDENFKKIIAYLTQNKCFITIFMVMKFKINVIRVQKTRKIITTLMRLDDKRLTLIIGVENKVNYQKLTNSEKIY